ncbi:MAG: AAA family ATPase [Pseudomonadota bacterium]
MLKCLAVQNYRSLLNLTVPLGELNVTTGPNGSGKSNLYRSLQLLAQTAKGGVVNALAREGGLDSAFWAGPEKITKGMRSGETAVQGGPKSKTPRIRLGFVSEEFGYAIAMGFPPNHGFASHGEPSKFRLDPEIKHESIWAGDVCRPANKLVERSGPVLKTRDRRKWHVLNQYLDTFESMFSDVRHGELAPELFHMRQQILGWRFYDQFRTDQESLARLPQIGTRTPVVSQDGRDLAAALQTILEIGDRPTLEEAIDSAVPGATLNIDVDSGARFHLSLNQPGLLRPLSGLELSDGTLRFLFLVAALLTPRPPTLMVLNEPETSLHPDLLPAVAKLIVSASKQTQIWVVSHAARLVNALKEHPSCNALPLEKDLGETGLLDQGMLDEPAWRWPDNK